MLPRLLSTRARRWSLAALLMGGVAAAGIGIGLLRARADRPPPLEVYGSLPAFELVDQSGDPFTDADLRGAPTIANFIFTRCPTVCPVFTMKMKHVADETADLGDRLTLVSLSVDPAYDSPAVLATYAADHDADTDRWSFLTGDPAAVRATVEDGLKISMARKGTSEDGVPDIVHGTHFVLLDADLQIRGYYDSSDIERIRALIRDARRLAEGGT